ncbi:MAG: hypothetical protein AAF298_14860 [Cyanobacteria bacterium P01_A01_bin.40]
MATVKWHSSNIYGKLSVKKTVIRLWLKLENLTFYSYVFCLVFQKTSDRTIILKALN